MMTTGSVLELLLKLLIIAKKWKRYNQSVRLLSENK